MISFDPISSVAKSLMLAASAGVPRPVMPLPPLARPNRPHLHRAGQRLILKLMRGDYFRSLSGYAGQPATRSDAGRPAQMNRAARRAHARQVQFA